VVSCLSGGRAVVVLLCVALAGCGAKMKMASAPMTSAPASDMAPPPLDRSLFARDPNGQLSEDALQKILAAPIELELPARIGVLPISTANDWRGPGPDARVPAGLSGLVNRLRKDAAFTLVTQTMVIPSGAFGMEALREIAARYRLRYMLLYREVIAKDTMLGPWAWGYATLVGALFLPGQRQDVYGYTEATMFDVKTGLLMFTTRRSITASQTSNLWHTDVKLARLASNAVAKFAPDLAEDVLVDLRRFAAAAIAENEQRQQKRVASSNSPVVSVPPAGPTVASDAP
jgi:hypothetical protein